MGNVTSFFKWSGVVGLMFLAILAGCQKNTTEPAPADLQLSSASTEGLVSSFQAIHSVNSFSQVMNMTSGEVISDQGELGGINSTGQLNEEFRKMQASLQTAVSGADGITIEDSLIWFIDWSDPISGISVRKALYYDPATGIARYYEAIYQFPQQLRLVYDSTEVKADLNFTLEEPSDDRFLSLSKLTEFDPDFYVLKIEADAQATDYDPENQVTGAIAHNHVWYGTQSRLRELTQELEINPDQSGSASERFDYRDNTFSLATINFYPDYTGDYSQIWRDGTRVTGTFDRLEDDNHASLTRNVDFPAGFWLDRIEQLADVTLFPEDSSSHVLLNEKLFFQSGRMDTSQLVVDEYFQNGLKKTHLVGAKSDGSRGDLLVTHFPEYQDVEGYYIGVEGYYSLIHAILYSDGSGDLWLTVYQNEQAYLNGEPPIATIYIHFNPDGSGEGQITEGDKKYTLVVYPNGEMEVRDAGGKSLTVKGY